MLPAVRDLQSTIAQEQQALAPQQQFIDQQITANDTSGTAQMQGLDTTKNNAFDQITQGAQNKGMLFSGVPIDEQAKYIGSTYIPAVANLQATIAGTRAQLIGKKLDLNKGAYDKASALVEGDRAVLNDWNKMTQQQQYQASEADKQRVFQAQQASLDRGAAAANAAASRAAAKDNLPTPAQFLVSAFSGYDHNAANGYTEKEIIPALMANYGITKEEAAQLAYTYRKNNYGV